MINDFRPRSNCSDSGGLAASAPKWLSILTAFLMISALTACADNYGQDDANLDQQRFNTAFRTSDTAAMAAAAARFNEGFDASRLNRAGASYCSQDVRNGLEYEARRVQKAAMDWMREKSESNALRVWDRVKEQEDKLANRTKSCSSDQVDDLKHLNALIALIRSDINEEFDLASLRKADDTRKTDALAQRLANCDLEEWRRKLVFQQFVRLEDIYGLEGRDKVISEVVRTYKISEECVDRTVRNATYDNPEWIPEPL